jgi:two-component system, NarL family, nitrate/nitrite response regulator NarL
MLAMRVLLVDDHELIWNGTRRLLERVLAELPGSQPLDFVPVRELRAALALGAERFDLILLDYHLPDAQGLAALQQMQAGFEGTTICMVSGESGAAHIRAVLDAGAAGFIPKSYGEAEMAMALRLVLLHKVYAPAEFLFNEDIVRGRDADEVASDQLANFLKTELSTRQRQVLALALQGLPNKTIARRLEIAEGTVKVHLSMVYKALGVKNRVGALCRVLQADAAGALDGP